MGIQNLQNICDAIYSAIKTSIDASNPSAMVGIFELEAPQNSALPVCTFQIVTDTVTQGLSKSISEDITLQVNFFGRQELGTKALRTISDALFNDFNRSTLDLAESGAVVSGTVQGITTIEDNNIINIRQEYEILSV